MAKDVIDLSKMTPDAIKSNVLNATLTNPLTIYPMVGGSMLLAFWLIFEAAWLFTLLGGVGFVIGVGMFSYNYFGRYQHHANKYFARLRTENDRMAKKKLKSIRSYLTDAGFEQGAEQVEKLQEKMKSFEKVLDRKFEPGEMAHARYHGVAEQVYLNSLKTLEQMVTELVAVDSIDPDYIKRRILELDEVSDAYDGLDDGQMAEREALDARWELREKHEKNVEVLLAQNEKAMTKLDDLSSKLATAQTSGDDVEADLARAMQNLEDLGAETQKNWGG